MNQITYEDAHLAVAAIRILEYQNQSPSTAADISRLLNLSIEQCLLTVKLLCDLDILKPAGGISGDRYFISDHVKIEALPRKASKQSMTDEIEKFKQSRMGMDAKIEAIKAERAEKQKHLFAEIEARLKKDMKQSS